MWTLFSTSSPGADCQTEYTASWVSGSTSFQISVDVGDIDDCGEGQFGMGAILTKRP
jgi:hypothetical protein